MLATAANITPFLKSRENTTIAATPTSSLPRDQCSRAPGKAQPGECFVKLLMVMGVIVIPASTGLHGGLGCNRNIRLFAVSGFKNQTEVNFGILFDWRI